MKHHFFETQHDILSNSNYGGMVRQRGSTGYSSLLLYPTSLTFTPLIFYEKERWHYLLDKHGWRIMWTTAVKVNLKHSTSPHYIPFPHLTPTSIRMENRSSVTPESSAKNARLIINNTCVMFKQGGVTRLNSPTQPLPPPPPPPPKMFRKKLWFHAIYTQILAKTGWDFHTYCVIVFWTLFSFNVMPGGGSFCRANSSFCSLFCGERGKCSRGTKCCITIIYQQVQLLWTWINNQQIAYHVTRTSVHASNEVSELWEPSSNIHRI